MARRRAVSRVYVGGLFFRNIVLFLQFRDAARTFAMRMARAADKSIGRRFFDLPLVIYKIAASAVRRGEVGRRGGRVFFQFSPFYHSARFGADRAGMVLKRVIAKR